MIVLPPEVAQDAVWQNVVKQMNDHIESISAQARRNHHSAYDKVDTLRAKLATSIAAKLKLIRV